MYYMDLCILYLLVLHFNYPHVHVFGAFHANYCYELSIITVNLYKTKNSPWGRVGCYLFILQKNVDEHSFPHVLVRPHLTYIYAGDASQSLT